jgi:hypothetical protein
MLLTRISRSRKTFFSDNKLFFFSFMREKYGFMSGRYRIAEKVIKGRLEKLPLL